MEKHDPTGAGMNRVADVEVGPPPPAQPRPGLRGQLAGLRTATRNLGIRGASVYALQRARLRFVRDRRLLSLVTPYAKFPLQCRANTSDLRVFRQIFVEREYSCLDDVRASDLIIDCGANVGYSSAYLLSRFPDCRVIAIEPDPGNFELMSRNLAPFGDRVQMRRAAVWSHPARLRLSEVPYRGGREWARQVRECRDGEEAEVPAVSIGSLLEERKHSRISILKMDIEGAEAVVFSSNYESWIDLVDNIVIELHDDSVFGNSSEVFAKAIAHRGFVLSESGGVNVCKRRL